MEQEAEARLPDRPAVAVEALDHLAMVCLD
jgi:hypothetical protein